MQMHHYIENQFIRLVNTGVKSVNLNTDIGIKLSFNKTIHDSSFGNAAIC